MAMVESAPQRADWTTTEGPMPEPLPKPEPTAPQPPSEPPAAPAGNVIDLSSRRGKKKASEAGEKKLTEVQQGLLDAMPAEGFPVEQAAIAKSMALNRRLIHLALKRLAHLGLIILVADDAYPEKRQWRRATVEEPADGP